MSSGLRIRTATATKPVIAHRFLNYLLDNKVAYDNFAGYVGYQPPITAISRPVPISRSAAKAATIASGLCA